MRHFVGSLAVLAVSCAAWAQNGAMISRDMAGEMRASSETYIVKFVETGALYYEGGNRNLAGTSPRATQSRKYQANTQAAAQYTQFLQERQAVYLQEIEQRLARGTVALHTYEVAYNGVAISLSADEAARVRQIPGVQSAEPAGVFQLATDAGPNLIGAPGIWDGSATPSGVATRGQNVVVGVIDSGGNADHPSFSNDASCGFSGANPKLMSSKDCLSANCVGGNAEDTDPSGTGHGVHTASTAAGNRLVPPLFVQGVPLRWEISGVAPCAKVRTYKVCATNSCDGAAIQRAIQENIVDQTDVLNYSISGGTAPWGDANRTFLDAVNGDIVVAASSGNTNATITDPVGAVNHRGPWVMTVANSTHDRIESSPVSVAGSLQSQPGQPGSGPAFTTTFNAQVVVASVLANELGCNPGFAPNSMNGRIALISRGTCPFSEKVTNATTAGASAVVIYNNAGGPPIAMGALGTTTVPSVMITQNAGTAYRNFLTANPNAQMTVVGPAARQIVPEFADILNASSLRGPNTTFDVTKPDITGPGTNIYAAIGDIAPAGGQAQFGFLSGTSMSSPHLAGAAALLRAVNPTWTPQEVKSAIQLTAKIPGFRQDGVTPWDADDVGNGRVDLRSAARSGVVLDETFNNFLAANPGSGGQPRNLNLPSLRHITCNGICQFTRTVRNTRNTPTNWTALANASAGTQVTIQPSTFSFNGGLAETQRLVITVRVPTSISALVFGDITLRAPSVPDARMTLAILGTGASAYVVNTPAAAVTACAGTGSGPVQLSLVTTSGATAPVTLSTVSAPAAFGTASFSVNPVAPSANGTSTVLSVPITAGTASGTYTLPIRGTATSHSFDGLINFNVSSGTPGAFSVSTPANNALNVALNTGFAWSASANAGSYVVEISRDAAFSSIIATGTVTGTSFNVGRNLRGNAQYFWRVRVANNCGTATASGQFTTVPNGVLFSDGFYE